jgi:hypothetical protein
VEADAIAFGWDNWVSPPTLVDKGVAQAKSASCRGNSVWLAQCSSPSGRLWRVRAIRSFSMLWGGRYARRRRLRVCPKRR